MVMDKDQQLSKEIKRRNCITIIETRYNFFTEAHEHFIEGALVEIKKYLKQVSHEKTSEWN